MSEQKTNEDKEKFKKIYAEAKEVFSPQLTDKLKYLLESVEPLLECIHVKASNLARKESAQEIAKLREKINSLESQVNLEVRNHIRTEKELTTTNKSLEEARQVISLFDEMNFDRAYEAANEWLSKNKGSEA